MSTPSISRLYLPIKFIIFFCTTLLFFMGQVLSANAEIFTENPNNPVFSYSGVNGTFDENRVGDWSVLKVNGQYQMYYAAIGNSNDMQIGLATSPDGVTWNRNSENPVFKCGDNTFNTCTISDNWSSYRVSSPEVLYENGIYKMWYLGNNENLNAVSELGYATSSDGVNWSAYGNNPVFSAGTTSGNSYISVINVDGLYHLYYKKGAGTDIYLATSLDGIVWTENSTVPVITTSSSIGFVNEINGTYVAISNTQDMFTSSDGVTFEQALDIDSEYLSTWMYLLYEDGIVKNWYSIYEGNVLWNYGNYSVGYATTTLTLLGLESNATTTTPEVAFVTLSEDVMTEIENSIEYVAVLPVYEDLMVKIVRAYENGKLVRADRRLAKFQMFVTEGLGKLLFTRSERQAINAIIKDMKDILVTEG